MRPRESSTTLRPEQVAWLKPAKPDGLSLLVVAQPNAKRSEIVGEHGGYLKIRVASPPVDGAANAELVRFLAEMLKIKPRQVMLVHGTASRKKEFWIRGVAYSEGRQRMGG